MFLALAVFLENLFPQKVKLACPKGSKEPCLTKYYKDIVGETVSLTRFSWKLTPMAVPRQI